LLKMATSSLAHRRGWIVVVFGVFAAASVVHPYADLVAGWVTVLGVDRWWARTVARERAKFPGAHFFGYRFWARYGGWAVFSGFFCFLLPTIAPKGEVWTQRFPSPLDEPWSTLPFLLLWLVIFFGWMVVIPVLGLGAALTAPDIGLVPTGLRLVPLPVWPVRDVSWSEIVRFVVREPRRGRRRDPISHYVYLLDGSYVPLYTRMMRDPEPLVAEIASHFPPEPEIWPPF
jgi:hypothetical protein